MSIPNTFLICLACVGCELLRKFTAILELEPQTLRHAADNMHVIALLLCFASRTPPASNAAIRSSACNCLLSRRELSSMPKSYTLDATSIAVPRADAHSPYAHIRRKRYARATRSRRAATSRNEIRSELARNASTVSTVPRAGANGHGYMTKPKSRQAEAFEANGWPNQVAERAAASFVHSIATAPPPYQTAPPPYAIDAVP